MSDALDTTNEIHVSKLLKHSPKRDSVFEKLKKELAPDVPGFRVPCPIDGPLELIHCRVS